MITCFFYSQQAMWFSLQYFNISSSEPNPLSQKSCSPFFTSSRTSVWELMTLVVLTIKLFVIFLQRYKKNRNSVLLFKNFYVNLQSQTAPITCKEGTGRIYIIGVYYAWFDCQNSQLWILVNDSNSECHSGYDMPMLHRFIMVSLTIIFGVGIRIACSRRGGNARPWQWDK